MIEKFVSLNAIAVPLNRGNVDTDAIIPARFLKTVKRTGLGDNLFHAWRYDEGGREVPDFPLNKPPYRGGKILGTGGDFGCGSPGGPRLLGPDGLRDPRRNLSLVRGYFLQQRAQERAPAGKTRSRRGSRPDRQHRGFPGG